MVAPIRYLSRREQQQKIGILSSTEDEKVLEVVGRVGIGTTIFDAEVQLDVRGGTNISGSLAVGSTQPTAKLDITSDSATDVIVSIANTENKTYPVGGSSFDIVLGLDHNIEVGGTQVVDGSLGYASAIRNTLTKSNNNTQDISSLRYRGIDQSFIWTDANTCKSYEGIKDEFIYSGHDANGDTSSSFEAGFINLVASDGETQTITTTKSDERTLQLRGAAISGTDTINITNAKGYSHYLLLLGANTGTHNYNITNFTAFETSPTWGSSEISGTVNATITNYYGLKLNPPSQTTGLTITNNYGVYSGWSSSKNYFAGVVGIGSTTPTAKLDVAGSFNVTGVSTFTGAIDANGDLDVDGQTNLDNVSIAGFSTFTSLLNCDGGFSSGLVQIGVSGIHRIDTSSGDLTIASAGGDIELSGDVGIGTDNPDAKLDVRGTLNVTGISTFRNNINLVSAGNTSTITGPSNLILDPAAIGDNTGKVIVLGDLQVDGTQTIIHSTTLEVDDKLISIAKSATNATQANGAGLDINGANATLTYSYTDDRMVFNKDLQASKFYGDGSGLTGIGISQIVGGVSGSLIGDASGSTTYYISATNATSGISSNTYVKSNIVMTGIGSVGIGTTQPTAKLDVVGSFNVTGVSTINNTIGNLKIINSADNKDINLFTRKNTDPAGIVSTAIRAVGSTGEVELYHSGVSKLTTKSTGIDVTGRTETDLLNVSGVSTFNSEVQVADKITHLGDTDTSIRFPTFNTFTVETAGSERLRITADGKVGIGTTAATAPLTVRSSAGNVDSGISLESTAGLQIVEIGQTAITGGGHLELKRSGSASDAQLNVGANNETTSNRGVMLWAGNTSNDFGRISIISNTETDYHSVFRVVSAPNSGSSKGTKLIFTSDGGAEFARSGDKTTINQKGLTSGIITATSFFGDGSNLTGVIAGIGTTASINTSGIITAASFVGDGSALTGVIAGIGTTASINTSGIITAASFVGDGSALTGIGSVSLTGDAFNVAGIATFNSDLQVADKIVHRGDTDTSIRFPAADTFTVETAGTERLRITSIGNVGIGTDNPHQRLFVEDSVIPVTIKRTTDAGDFIYLRNNNYYNVIGGDNGSLYFKTNGTGGTSERLRITSGGNVGIGTEIPTNAVDTNNTKILNVGVVTANFYYGDGSNLSNIPGFAPDADGNLFAGGDAGGSYSPDGSAKSNIFIGCNSGECISTGDYNNFYGWGSGQKNTTGGCNTFLGFRAGQCNTTGAQNVALGHNSMGFGAEHEGNKNAVIGLCAGYCLRNGSCNVFLGACAGFGHTSGCSNNFFGMNAGKCNTSGSCNTFLGFCAGRSSTTGSCNVVIGRSVELPSATGNNQLAIGDGTNRWIAGDSSFNTTIAGIATVYAATGIVSATKFCGDGSCLTGLADGGFSQDVDGNLFAGTNAGGSYDPSTGAACFNIFLGCNSGSSIVGGGNNIFLGCQSGAATDNGNANVFLGAQAGFSNTDGACNVFIGHDAGCKSSTGTKNVFIGECAGNCNTGDCNVNIGNGAACCNKDGNANVFLGAQAGFSVQEADCSVYIGHNAGRTGNAGAAWSPKYNVLIGDSVGYAHTELGCGVLIGKSAGYKSGSTYGISIGYQAGMCDSGLCNIAIGKDALKGATVTGCNNIAIGQQAAQNTDTGCDNVFIGFCAGLENTSGKFNTFLGCGVGACNKTGSWNTFIGIGAGFGLTEGTTNIIIGTNASRCTTTGNDNTIIGSAAGRALVSSCSNTFIGVGAGQCVTSLGENNLFLGANAGRCSSGTGACNIFAGFCAGCGNNDGDNNVFIGTCAGLSNTDGVDNILIGREAGKCLTTGNSNIFIGDESAAGTGDKTGKQNIFLGKGSGKRLTSGCYNIFFGECAGYYNTTASQNIYIGRDAGYSNTTGSKNIAIGDNALYKASGPNADTNVAMGIFAGACVTTGCHNLLIGTCKTGFCITTGGHNTIIGRFAGHGNPGTGMFNVFMGGNAGKCFTSGGKNVIIGDYAGCLLSSGSGNAFLGNYAGRSTASGCYNVFLGRYAGNTNTSGDKNIAIGCNVELPSNTGDCQLGIGNGTDRWITGDSSYNTTLSGIATVYAATGIVSATKFCGDGSALTGLAGFVADADKNMLAGTNIYPNLDPSSDSACFNIALGCGIAEGGAGTITGDCNIFFGLKVGRCVTSAAANIFMGRYTGNQVTTGSDNIFLGSCAGAKACAAQANIFLGTDAGCVNDNGRQNVAIGDDVMKCAGDNGGCNKENVVLGTQAGKCTEDSCYNIMIGACAGLAKTTGSSNIFLGDSVGRCCTSGSLCSNIVMGREAGKFLTCTQSHNIIIGSGAGKFNQGCQNIFMGAGSGDKNCGGDCNIVIGSNAGGDSSDLGNVNIIIGVCAGDHNTGCCNVFIGRNAGLANTNGSNNFFVGACAGCSNTSGGCNTFLGFRAGNTNTSGDKNIAIGYDVELPSATADNQFAIGSGTNHWITGDSSYNVDIPNTLSKGGGSFKIDHPHPTKTNTHYLVHSFIEGPKMDLLYRGRVDLVAGTATVNIDEISNMTEGTFVLLNRDVQSFTTNETGWTAVKSSVSGNLLTITAQDSDCTDTISWMVIGERQDDTIKSLTMTDDDGNLIVEPLKES